MVTPWETLYTISGLTLEELVAETLVQKNLRIRREKCRHNDVYSSTVTGPCGTFANKVCLDCGKRWGNPS